MRHALLVLAFLAAPARAALGDGYVACSGSATIEPFDPGVPAPGTTVSLGTAAAPSDVTMTPDGTQAWIANGMGAEDVQVLDCATDAIIQRIPLGFFPAGVAFSDDGAYAAITCKNARNVTAVSVQLQVPMGTTPLQGPPGAITMDSATGLFYAVEDGGGSLYEIDQSAYGLLRTAPIGLALSGVVAAPDCNGLYVTDFGSHEVHVVDRATLTVTRSMAVGARPWGIDVTRDGRTLVVACQFSRDVHLVDTASWTSVAVPLDADSLPLDVDIDDARRRAFVTATRSTPAPDVVFVIDLDAAALVGSFDPTGDGEAVLAVQPQATSAFIGIAVTDADADGRLFACDNCPDAANPGQEDADGDGVGDACEGSIRCDEPSALDLVPGVEPLRVAKTGGSLRLTWQDLPGQMANAYSGSLAVLHASATYDHGDVGACALAGGALLAMPAGDVYVLVGGDCGSLESSLGRDSFGAERPAATPACP